LTASRERARTGDGLGPENSSGLHRRGFVGTDRRSQQSSRAQGGTSAGRVWVKWRGGRAQRHTAARETELEGALGGREELNLGNARYGTGDPKPWEAITLRDPRPWCAMWSATDEEDEDQGEDEGAHVLAQGRG
jgi:hypothetical protein